MTVRTHRSRLTRTSILAAALALVDNEGLEALSMRRLGKELGVEAMSLYNHVPNKAALLDGLVEQVMAGLEPPPDGISWQDQVRAMARSYRRVVGAHPNVAPLIAMRPLNTEASLEPLETALRVLRNAGFEDAAALHGVRMIAGFATGYVLGETGSFFGEARPTAGGDVLDPSALDPERFPHITAMIPTLLSTDHDAEYEAVLDTMLEGLESQLR